MIPAILRVKFRTNENPRGLAICWSNVAENHLSHLPRAVGFGAQTPQRRVAFRGSRNLSQMGRLRPTLN